MLGGRGEKILGGERGDRILGGKGGKDLRGEGWNRSGLTRHESLAIGAEEQHTC